MAGTFYHPNLDTLIFAMEERPATRARALAWEFLAAADAFAFDNGALVVPSATWSATVYKATPTSCTCPAKGHCWHKEAAIIVTNAQREDEWFDLCDAYGSVAEASREWQRRNITRGTMQRDAAQRAAAYAGIDELFAS